MKNDIYIIGAGGHGEVILDILLKNNIVPKGFLDDNRSLWNKEIQGIKVLGRINLAKELEGKFIIAIGDNEKRKEIVNYLKFNKEKFINAIHPSVILGNEINYGYGNMIIGGVFINTKTKIGDHTIINTSSSIDHHNIIGDFVHIAPGVHTGGNVTIAEGSLIGIGSTILPNIKIGRWSIVGAGSVVIDNIPDNVVVVGVPAKIIKKRK
ncbi:MAG: acetyltransferase [Caldisericia bacterium]